MAVIERQPTVTRLAAAARAADRQGSVLLAALVAACAYAAFASGATATPQETRVQVALAALAVAAAALVAGGSLRLPSSRAVLVGLGGLLAFAGWNAVTLLWTVAPDETWAETNRAIAYALAAALAVAAGASTPRAVQKLAVWWLWVAVVVALDALGGKLIPGVHVGGLVDFNTTADVARLRSPLGYWNALALLLVLALPVAIRLSAGRERAEGQRLAASAAAWLLICVIGMTYSRGALLGVAGALVVMVALGPGRLRTIAAAALPALAAIPVLAVAFGADGLSKNGASLHDRSVDGGLLALGMLVCLAALLAVGRWLVRHEDRAGWTATHSRRVWRTGAAVACWCVFAVACGAAGAHRGVDGVVSRAANSFAQSKQDDLYDPSRLTTTNSGNRWIWWKEAAGAWSAKPVGGWGAGSFPVTHLLYREDQTPVRQPHSVPIQWLAETGLVGLILALGGVGGLGWAAATRTYRMRGAERDLAVALLGGCAAYAAHALYDWDWDIPGVTLPALIFAGVLAGAGLRARTPAASSRPAELFVDPERATRGTYARGIAVAGASLVAACVIASAVLPSIAQSKADDALAKAGADTVSDATLTHAAAEADLAARLDPLADEPRFAQATIAQRRGRLLDARGALLDAVKRQPYDPRAWTRLAGVAIALADRPGYAQATRRAFELDPRNPVLRTQAVRGLSVLTPNGSSATATGTPLAPKAVVVAPSTSTPSTTTPTPATTATPRSTSPLPPTGGVPESKTGATPAAPLDGRAIPSAQGGG